MALGKSDWQSAQGMQEQKGLQQVVLALVPQSHRIPSPAARPSLAAFVKLGCFQDLRDLRWFHQAGEDPLLAAEVVAHPEAN